MLRPLPASHARERAAFRQPAVSDVPHCVEKLRHLSRMEDIATARRSPHVHERIRTAVPGSRTERRYRRTFGSVSPPRPPSPDYNFQIAVSHPAFNKHLTATVREYDRNADVLISRRGPCLRTQLPSLPSSAHAVKSAPVSVTKQTRRIVGECSPRWNIRELEHTVRMDMKAPSIKSTAF